MTGLQRALGRAFERIESVADRVFDPDGNPLRMLGALGWLFFWVATGSGIYLYIFFDSGVQEAYQSVEYLTHGQWYAGGIMRSLHRYASDALVVVVILHLTREFAFGRYAAGRWFTWVTGVPVLWLMFAAGISGYWVVWDRLAQYLAVATTEWLDTLPLFGQSIARNFLNEETLSGRFFTLMIFIHIAAPLFMLFLMWVHVQRLAAATVNPPRRVALAILAMLLGLSLLYPALSQGPANLDRVVGEISLDWFYLGAYPLLDHVPGERLWLAAALLTCAVLAAPWLLPRSRAGIAVVDLDNCNGCARCFADCPYGAISMTPRTDGAPFAEQATVDAGRCVGCGLCVGACPTATPFRRRTALIPGIDLVARPLVQLRDGVLAAGGAMPRHPRILTFICEHGPASVAASSTPGIIPVACVGALPPSFIDFALTRAEVDGVMLAGCSAGACYHRLGIRWTEARMRRQRNPYLRARVAAARVRTCWAGSSGARRFAAEMATFTTALEALDPARPDVKTN